MRRIVSVWLPDWPITAWSRAAGRTPPPDGAPFVLVETRGGKGLVIAAANTAARAHGLCRGQSHADARAILPDLTSAPDEPDEAAAALKRIALWAERYSPCVAVDQALPACEGLFLDMSGAAHLFGGEASLLAHVEARFAAAGMAAQAAIADSPGAAWALARFGDLRLAAPGGSRDALADLPVQALRLGPDTLKLLGRFGLKRIGDLYGLPRAGLARRFRGAAGLDLVRRFDQALGVEGEPLEPVRPAPLYRAWRAFAEPLIDVEGVGHVLPPLVEALAGQLDRDGKGARRLRLTAFRTDGRSTALEVGLGAASAGAAHLVRLFRERGLERLDLGFGADALMVEAVTAETTQARQGDITGDREAAADAALSVLVDRLEAKLGDGAVRRPILIDSHIPERSESWTVVGATAPSKSDPGHQDGPRPLLLLEPPEPIEAVAELPDSAPVRFIWRRMVRNILRVDGPERLAPEWWRSQTGSRPERTRDYYRVEDDAGRRYWLFREGLYEQRPFLSPADDRPRDVDEERLTERLPTWWMHGVFA